ncbi:MAG: serine hydrolase domain-containing protein [Ignavibacteria bacterium]|nr:serine hydrolase domain-containing protein [Ignavibacteria bacterium]MDP3829692.1 serine hydrolase domain-containing protein [Ignavibacteriaceae bacterium]
MKTSVMNLVSIFALKIHYFFPLLIITSLSFINQSCKEESSPIEPQKKILTTGTIAKLEAAADKVMMEKQAPGMIAYIAVEGEGELFITRGVGNLTTSEPMNKTNYFRMASVTKTFTTEAALILVDEGKIDLNKTISFYLPEYAIPGRDTITIRMLGNMTSGLIEVLGDSALGASYYGSLGTIKFTPEELIAPLFTSQLQFIPGSQFNYCNSNTILLGLIIKKVTGQALKDVFVEKIFQPLGLIHTFWPETNYLPSPYHHAYTSLLGTINQDVTYWGNSWGNAAGILVSNLADLKIWAKEIAEGNLLSANSKNERYLMGAAGSGYGFGVEMILDLFGHSGGIIGWNSMVFYDKTKKITIITQTNSIDDKPASYAFQQFAKALGY